jgi:hypothetical protein
MFLLFPSLVLFYELCFLKNYVPYPKQGTTHIRNWATIFTDPSFTMFWLLFGFWINAAFEIIITNNSHTRHINLTETRSDGSRFCRKKKVPIIGIQNMAHLSRCVFRMALAINDLCGEDVMCFLWVMKWICIHYLEKLQCTSTRCLKAPWAARQQNAVMNPVELGIKNDCAGEDQRHIFTLSKICTCFKMESPLRRQEGLTITGHSPSIGGDSRGPYSLIGPFLHPHAPRQTQYLPIKAYFSS